VSVYFFYSHDLKVCKFYFELKKNEPVLLFTL
jgi:hypothetical protein